MKKLLLAVMLSCGLSVVANAANIQAVAQIDAHRYSGKWYEIARLPMYFQRKCVSHVSATYTLNSDHSFTVTNRCLYANGKWHTAEGKAVAQNSGFSQLKVTFLPNALRWIPKTSGDYWILRIDPQYQVVLVGDPNRKYLWLLARTPSIDEKIYQSYLNTAKQMGYNLTPLIKTKQ